MRHLATLLIVLYTMLSPWPLQGVDSSRRDQQTAAEILSGLELRAIGPALMGGRIADIAVNPANPSTWYVAVGSGGVWKTTNAGTTWLPVFDQQPSYSVGCVTMDPSTPETIWVGTGENVSGRHVGWGDGIYKSLDGGKTWRQMGLESSEHIGNIVVDPSDGDRVLVAAEGPLWSSGGERGLYRTTDGGETWDRVLHIDDDTGVTDVEMDPADPNVIYAATYQRRRHIWSLLAGGPGSGIHKSTDGGDSWRRLEGDLPTTDMGKIGLAVSPADPRVVYATIEAAEDERGFYRSRDRGESWEKRTEYISNGTGPHYYQEIEASPHDVDTVYQMDVFIHVTRDGGATFEILGSGREKHSDNHALVIDPRDPRHLLAGTDASLYESYDDGMTWRQIPNLPVSQFYKLALSNDEPFYSIVGGAQDLGTLLGPSRTASAEGVRNLDWYVPLGADGYACAFDPDEPDVAYMEIQGGLLHRYDRRTHELLDIQPMPAPGDPPERWNWDSPLTLSPHFSTRLYFGSQRLWRSDDRGSSWTVLSGDLTRNTNRYELDMLGRVWSVDSLWDNDAMSLYGTLTAISESTLVEGLLYVGTDDGLIQVSEDGGANWRRVETLPGVPERSFVNDIYASRHDSHTVFAALDAHKIGSFSPLLLESRDRGRTWRSIAGDLPDRTIVWSLEQDHIHKDLLFAGTEFGLYFTPDRGSHWIQLSGGVPTISFRDIQIQRRDSDLVGATFGRGFYVLDDYAPLRDIAAGALDEEFYIFPVRHAWWYIPQVPMQARGRPSLGSSDFAAPNPPFGAVFTYFLKKTKKSSSETRQEEEEELEDSGQNVPFPGWERLAAEHLEHDPKLLLTIRDATGETVRRVEGPLEAGLHRVAWDLRRPPPDPVDLEVEAFQPPWWEPPQGPLAAPGRYTVEAAILSSNGVAPVGQMQEFSVEPAFGSDLSQADLAATTAFQMETSEQLRQARGAAQELERIAGRLRHLRAATLETPKADVETFSRLDGIELRLAQLRTQLQGDEIRGGFNEASTPSILDRLGKIAWGHWGTRQTPTVTQRESLDVARRDLAVLNSELRELVETLLEPVEAQLEAAGAPWTPGRRLP